MEQKHSQKVFTTIRNSAEELMVVNSRTVAVLHDARWGRSSWPRLEQEVVRMKVDGDCICECPL